MSAEKILLLLEKVRETGRNKWSACCPAHDDKGPSLAIKEADDGRVLIHCFAGCGACEVLDALNMTFADLYPEEAVSGHSQRAIRKPWNAMDVLTALAYQALVVANCASTMAAGEPLSDASREQLVSAAARIHAGLDLINE